MEYSFSSQVLPFIILIVVGYLWLMYDYRKKKIKDINTRIRINQQKFFFRFKSEKDIIKLYLDELLKLGIIKTINHRSIDKVYFYVSFNTDDDSYSLYKRWTELSDLWYNPWRPSEKKLKQYTYSPFFQESSYRLNFLKEFDYKKLLVKGYNGKAEYLDNVKDKDRIEQLYKKIKTWNEAEAEEKNVS